MKKQFELIKTLLIVVVLLAVFQVMLLLIAPDTKHIILSIIVFAGLIAVIIFYLLAKREVKNIVFESKGDNVEVRIVNYDDFPHLRQLLDETPLENTDEERIRLEEYEAITIDYVRIKYHYIVIIDGVAEGLFKTTKNNDNWKIEWIKVNEERKNDIQEYILNNTVYDRSKVVF